MTNHQPAALDTSFWTVGHRADILHYLFAYFTVYVPPAVRNEITTVDPMYPRRRYGYAEVFRVLESRRLLHAATPARVSSQHGRGEAEAIALAQEHGWLLLVNDRRAFVAARSAGIAAIPVPSFIVFLYEQGVLSLASAEVKLRLIASYTSHSVLQPAREELQRLAKASGEPIP